MSLAASVLGEAPSSSKSNGVARAAVDEELLIGRAVSTLLDIEDPYRRVAEGQTTDAVSAALAEQLAAICARLPERPAADLAAVRALLDRFERWAAVHRHDALVKHFVDGWVSFHVPHHIDHEHLVPLRRPDPSLPNVMEGLPEHRRRRDGFTLTDARMPAREILNEVDYCLYCHDREKDSCSTGLHDKQGAAKKNPLGIALNGCPLDERISEMHVLKKGGDSLAALAMITIDNPMLPGTGHRICNDCMKACVYQKQEPVNIPQAETAVLTDVLKLPWGFEIYTFLTRWNPLNRRRPYALPYNGKNVLVVGLGPAGYTLSHHLANEGFGVVGVDGLKIEPLPADLLGGDAWPPRAIESFSEIESDLVEAHLGRPRRRGRVRHHRALGQELPDDDPPGAGAAAQLPRLRRRALRRHAGRRGRVRDRASTTSRSPPAPASRRSST